MDMVPRKRMGQFDKGTARFFPGFKMEIMWACFHTAGKYYASRAALNIVTRRDKTRYGRCFSALYGILFGPGALPIYRPWMTSCTSAALVNMGYVAGAKVYACSASLSISITAGFGMSFTG